MAINQASLDRFRSPTDSRSHPNKPGGGCAFRCHSARSISGGACCSGSGAARFRPLLRSLAGVLAGVFAGVFAGVEPSGSPPELSVVFAFFRGGGGGGRR